MSRNGVRIVAVPVVLALLIAGTTTTRAPGHEGREIVEVSDSSGYLRVVTSPESGLSTVFVDVAVDEEFIDRNGTDWMDALDLAIWSANELLEDVGVKVELSSVSTWESDDDQAHMSRILDDILATTPRGFGRMLLGVTCQDSIKFDGVARKSEAAVAVRHVHDDWQRNGSLIAHEIAHLLGAEHHPENEECESDGCLMETAGYAHATEWCDDHVEAISAFLSASVA